MMTVVNNVLKWFFYTKVSIYVCVCVCTHTYTHTFILNIVVTAILHIVFKIIIINFINVEILFWRLYPLSSYLEVSYLSVTFDYNIFAWISQPLVFVIKESLK